MEEGFGSRLACRIVGITPRQLQYWDETALVKPSLSPASGRGTRRRYSFADLVRLSVVRWLIERDLPPRTIRKSLAVLARSFPQVLDPLARHHLVTDGQRLFLVTADREAMLDVLDRQFVFFLALGPIVEELKGQVVRLSDQVGRGRRDVGVRRSTAAAAGGSGR